MVSHTPTLLAVHQLSLSLVHGNVTTVREHRWHEAVLRDVAGSGRTSALRMRTVRAGQRWHWRTGRTAIARSGTTGTPGLGMLRQQRQPRERLRARRTLEALHVLVRLLVRAQIRPVGERARAQLAHERLLAGVRADVALQQPRARERLVTVRTLARQRVRTDVHLERTERLVRLVALLAHERLLRLVALGRRAVELLVLGQARVGRIRLTAVRALVARGTVSTRRRRSLLAATVLLLQDVRARGRFLRQDGGAAGRGREGGAVAVGGAEAVVVLLGIGARTGGCRRGDR